MNYKKQYATTIELDEKDRLPVEIHTYDRGFYNLYTITVDGIVVGSFSVNEKINAEHLKLSLALALLGIK